MITVRDGNTGRNQRFLVFVKTNWVGLTRKHFPFQNLKIIISMFEKGDLGCCMHKNYNLGDFQYVLRWVLSGCSLSIPWDRGKGLPSSHPPETLVVERDFT